MQAENKSGDQRELSFIEKARRAQIVECAIDAIATLGYARASLAQIAERAGISKGVISYHFAGKEELIQQVVAAVFTAGAAFMRPRIEAETSAAGMLRAYIESNLDFMRTHRKHILAIVEIWSHFRSGDGLSKLGAEWLEPGLSDLEKLLRWGQDNGEFRAFSTRVMAMALRGAIDSVPAQMATQENVDLDAYAQELVTLFDRATRREI
jgi:TetR/AcrR family transcriptional regulator, fatty acid metabolism regulator protein